MACVCGVSRRVKRLDSGRMNTARRPPRQRASAARESKVAYNRRTVSEVGLVASACAVGLGYEGGGSPHLPISPNAPGSRSSDPLGHLPNLESPTPGSRSDRDPPAAPARSERSMPLELARATRTVPLARPDRPVTHEGADAPPQSAKKPLLALRGPPGRAAARTKHALDAPRASPGDRGTPPPHGATPNNASGRARAPPRRGGTPALPAVETPAPGSETARVTQ